MIIKEKYDYEKEEEYRLVATPSIFVYPQKMQLYQYDEIMRNDESLVRSIVDYTKWAKRTVLCPSDEYLRLFNLRITSISVHPEMSHKSKEQFEDFCKKYL